jgi:hypothetical protein
MSTRPYTLKCFMELNAPPTGVVNPADYDAAEVGFGHNVCG